MCASQDLVQAAYYFATTQRPAPAGDILISGTTLLVNTIARFWRLEDRYQSPIQLVARRNLIHLLSEPMHKIAVMSAEYGGLKPLTHHILKKLAILVDDFFFSSQLTPRTTLLIHDTYNPDLLGMSKLTQQSPVTATIELWAIDEQGNHRTVGRMFEILVHEMCHAYLDIFCCEKTMCLNRQVDMFTICGVSGHGPGWCALMFAISDEIRRWKTPFGKSFNAMDHSCVEETSFLKAAIGAFPQAQDEEEKRAIKASVNEQGNYEFILAERHIRYRGGMLQTWDNRVQLMTTISDDWKKMLETHLPLVNDWLAKDQATECLLKDNSLYSFQLDLPGMIWDPAECSHEDLPVAACEGQDDCPMRGACVHTAYVGGTTTISLAPMNCGNDNSDADDEDILSNLADSGDGEWDTCSDTGDSDTTASLEEEWDIVDT